MDDFFFRWFVFGAFTFVAWMAFVSFPMVIFGKYSTLGRKLTKILLYKPLAFISKFHHLKTKKELSDWSLGTARFKSFFLLLLYILIISLLITLSSYWWWQFDY